MSTLKEKFKDRYIILAMIFVVVGVFMVLRLAELQIVKGEELNKLSQTKLLNTKPIPAPRGNIVDRYGVPIAVNQMGYTVQIVKTKHKSKVFNEMLLNLIHIFEKNNDSYNDTLKKYITFNPIDFGKTVSSASDKIKKLKNDTGLKYKGLDVNATANQVFDYLRKTVFEIDSKYTDEEAYKIMTLRFEILIHGYSTLASNVSQKTMAEIEERHLDFPGVLTDIQPIRKYVDGAMASHVLGYIGSIRSEDYPKYKENGYKMNELVGLTGIEAFTEGYLRGKEGQKLVEEDTSGRQTEELGVIPAEPGNDVILTLDMQLQKVAMRSLERVINDIKSKKDGKKNFGDAYAGSVVAIDVNTGEVLAMASYPTYDPSVFLESSSNKEAQKTITDLLTDNKNKTLLNRAIAWTYYPGSTYKPVTAVAGLEEGAITPETVIYDSGTTMIGGRKFTCLEYKNGQGAHGALKLVSALATSCNIYFHELGSRIGIDKLDKWAKLFGLGEKTGIDIPGEKSGNRANKEYKKQQLNDSWRPADTAQAAIGQFDNKFTPLQLANYVSTLANGGKRFKPHLIKQVIKYDGSTVLQVNPEFEQIPVKPQTINAVKEGMVAVNNSQDGTAKGIFDDLVVNGIKITVAGKTGTPETGREAYGESSNSLYVCYAPAEKPEIAVAVVIEHGVWGSNAAPVARDVLAEYFKVDSKNSQQDIAKPDSVVFTR